MACCCNPCTGLCSPYPPNPSLSVPTSITVDFDSFSFAYVGYGGVFFNPGLSGAESDMADYINGLTVVLQLLSLSPTTAVYKAQPCLVPCSTCNPAYGYNGPSDAPFFPTVTIGCSGVSINSDWAFRTSCQPSVPDATKTPSNFSFRFNFSQTAFTQTNFCSLAAGQSFSFSAPYLTGVVGGIVYGSQYWNYIVSGRFPAYGEYQTLSGTITIKGNQLP